MPIDIPAYHIPLSSLRRLMALVESGAVKPGRRVIRRHTLIKATSSLFVIGRAYQDTTQEIAGIKTAGFCSKSAQRLRELEAHRHILVNLNAHLRQFGTARATSYNIAPLLTKPTDYGTLTPSTHN